jgi:hypothetical protein
VRRYFYTLEQLAADDPLRRSPASFREYIGPPLSQEIIQSTQQTLGVALPEAYIKLLRESNGGFLIKSRFFCAGLKEEVEIDYLSGIGYSNGLDGPFGSLYMTQEWDYPESLLWLGGDGHTGFFLDYRSADPGSNPPVVWYDTEGDAPQPIPLAETFAEFLEALY